MSCARYASPHYRRAAMDSSSWLHKHVRAPYLYQCAMASPPWVDRKALRELAEKARRLTRETGIEHTLDHEIPLTHPRVCGLNVPANIRIIPRHANLSKSNAWCQWHGELFDEPEQFSLWPRGEDDRIAQLDREAA